MLHIGSLLRVQYLLLDNQDNGINNLVLVKLSVCLMIFAPSCFSPIESEEDVLLEDAFQAEAGYVYEVRFDEALDTLQTGTEYSGRSELLRTPLAAMAKKAIIIKADDLKGHVSDRWKQYFSIVEYHNIAHSAGVICNSVTNVSDSNRDYLRTRLERKAAWVEPRGDG